MDLGELEPLRKKIYELALKWEMSPKEVVSIYRKQFKLIREVMKEDFHTRPIEERRSIKVRGLGTFEFNEYIAKKITDLKKEKDDRENLAKEIATNGERDSIH